MGFFPNIITGVNYFNNTAFEKTLIAIKKYYEEFNNQDKEENKLFIEYVINGKDHIEKMAKIIRVSPEKFVDICD
jgi:hypothetical protein